MTLSRRLTSAVALLCVTGALAACGDDDEEESGGSSATPAATEESSGGGGGGETLALTAGEGGGGYSFDPAQLEAPAGSVTITLDNPDSNAAPHAVEVEGNGVEEVSDTVSPGATAEVTADLEPGEYVFYCPVGNHRQAGMEGTLTVN